MSVAASHGGRREGLSPLTFEAHLDHMRAALVISIKLLAVHAVDAFVDVDVSLRMYRLYGTLISATLAGGAAFGPASQPLEHPDTPWDR